MAQSHGDGHGRRRGGGINQNANQADTQWYEVTLDFTAPKDCTAVTVTITENTWLRVDDVSLVEII